MSRILCAASLILIGLLPGLVAAQSGAQQSIFVLSVEIPPQLELKNTAFKFSPDSQHPGAFTSAWQTVAYANTNWRVDFQLTPFSVLQYLTLLPVATQYRVEIRVNGIVQTHTLNVAASELPTRASLQMLPVPHDGKIEMRFSVKPVEPVDGAALNPPSSPGMLISVNSF